MSSIKVNDYLIDQAGLDWQTMLSGWGEVLPPTFTIWLVNRFGDVFIVPDDGAVYLLDVSGGTFSRLAQSQEEFADLIDVPQNANNWLMIPLVDECMALGMSLQTAKCYGFKIPPLLGGEYFIGNIAIVDLTESYAFLADLWSQTKDVPDGARVRLVISPHPDKH
jgi:hypothetical protein